MAHLLDELLVLMNLCSRDQECSLLHGDPSLSILPSIFLWVMSTIYAIFQNRAHIWGFYVFQGAPSCPSLTVTSSCAFDRNRRSIVHLSWSADFFSKMSHRIRQGIKRILCITDCHGASAIDYAASQPDLSETEMLEELVITRWLKRTTP
jgi:hypothetical protein